ncbi:MAG: molybdopterin cofactor-binding domain-containing protein, partial [Pseudomonadales bacterium]
LVAVNTEPLPAVVNIEGALAEDAPLLHEGWEDNRLYQANMQSGEVDAAFAEADLVVEAEYETNRHCAASLEGRAVLAAFDAVSKRLTVWSSTQIPHMIRTKLAELLDFPERNLRVIAPDVGGGFGLKCHIFPEELIIAALALELGRPVKWVEDRREHYTASLHAKEESVKVSIALNRNGEIRGLDARFASDAGAYAGFPFTPSSEPSMAAMACVGPYKIRAVRTEAMAVCTNKSTSSVCRGVGLPISVFAVEHTLDKAAAELGIDPVELRRRNLLARDDFPYVTPYGARYDSGSPRESLEQVAELIDCDEFRREQASAREEGHYLGIGFASMIELTTFGRDVMAGGGWGKNVTTHDAAYVRVDPDGSVTLSVGTHSHGQSHETTFSQLVSSVLGCPMENVRFVQGDTDQTPFGGGTWGSRSAVAGGGAVLRATTKVRDKAIRVAAHLMEASPEDVELNEDGDFELKGAPVRHVTLKEVARAVVYEGDVPDGEEPTLEAMSAYQAPSPYSNATHAAVVEVDPGTGQVKLLRYAVSEDCGRMINPMVVDGQVLGGVVQGLGSVLFEHHQYDEYGQLMTATMMDYLMPTAPGIPPITIGHLETPSPISEGGIKGMGEGGAVAPLGAIANAVSDALVPLIGWQSVGELPITPERIYEMLGIHGTTN